MGAWGAGVFENDLALDFVDTVVKAQTANVLDVTLSKVVEEDVTYLAESICSEGLVACEVVAAMLGEPAPELPRELAGWAQGRSVGYHLRRKAETAVELVTASSELRDLWMDSEHFDCWVANMTDLKRRLRKT